MSHHFHGRIALLRPSALQRLGLFLARTYSMKNRLVQVSWGLERVYSSCNSTKSRDYHLLGHESPLTEHVDMTRSVLTAWSRTPTNILIQDLVYVQHLYNNCAVQAHFVRYLR